MAAKSCHDNPIRPRMLAREEGHHLIDLFVQYIDGDIGEEELDTEIESVRRVLRAIKSGDYELPEDESVDAAD